MSAAGRVRTGFSLPYVAVYSNSAGTTSYSSGQQLARGVDVSITAETAEGTIFYADNVAAETTPARMTSASGTLTVDGLFDAAEKLILGLPAATSVTVDQTTVDEYNYGDDMEPPYVGIGFIERYLSDGTESFVPVVLPKCRFKIPADNAATAEEEMSFQTQALDFDILRDDTTNHVWKKRYEAQDSEADALAVLEEILDI